jgi:phosphoadenosine phosphosulfate reductase
LHALEYEACAFIEEVLHKYSGRVPVVAFSGGKDSTAVSLLGRRVLPAADLLHVFGDTGIESPDTVDFIETFRRDNPQIPLITAQPQSDFFELCETLGPPSRIKRWCCSTQKVVPLALVYGVLSEQGGVLTLCGVRRAESSRRKAHKRVLTDTKITNEVMASPILEWSDTEVWLFLMSQNQQVNRAYRRGFRRVGCMYCPFESKWSEYLKTVYLPEQVKGWECFVNGYYRSRAKNQTEVPGIDRWKARAGGLSRSDDLSSLRRRPCDDDTSSFSIECRGSVPSGFWEYMRPFGHVRISYDDGLLSHGLVLDETGDVLFDMRVSRPRGHIRVTLHVQKYQRLLSQRITRQIRKALACVPCGFCQTVCPANAISCNGHYAIDPEKCVHCLRCVREIRGGCVAAHATRVTGNR